ncbi:MAG: glutathione S-transferase N-terminal domain-containing protein [Rhodobacteraceae bacterium]|jgi:glutathione S-transferase|nr:glutathione S-transferase N-terminal domain-containing protein [Paracoccaceae bacterium]
MKVYFAPGTCSLATLIVLEEISAVYQTERVDLAKKLTETGEDYRRINPRGAVPALLMDNGEVLTENTAIMQYVCDSLAPGYLPAGGTVARARVLEALSYIGSEVHKSYSPLFRPMAEDLRAAQIAVLDARLAVVEGWLADGRSYLTGEGFGPQDAYLYTVTGWSQGLGHDLSAFPAILAHRARVGERPSVQRARARSAG